MKPFKLIENDDVKILRSENANYNFCKKTGYTELWGKTKDDEILFSEIGPFILDIEVTTICKHGCKFCSPPGTRVNTKDGFKNIEDIKVGEDVLGVVFSDGKKFIKTQTVQELYVNDYDGELIQIETENGDVLKLTPDHVVFLKDGTEKPAGELTIEDELISIEEFKTCRDCGKVITSKAYKRYYCSKSCWDNGRGKKCLICGEPFVGKYKNDIFCSCIDCGVGNSKHPLMNTYKTMLYRCYNPERNKHEFYADRGITVDPRWFSFETFVNDMGERPEGYTLDRIDNNKGYSKENCRWVDINLQRANRGKFSNSKCKYKGVVIQNGKYLASFRYKNEKFYLGSFDNELDAAKAYNEMVKKYYPNDYERIWNIL